jgi:hypothetical protein
MTTTKSLKLTPNGADMKHIMSSNNSFKYENISEDGQAIKLVVTDKAVISHDEHAKIVLEKGTYYKFNQVEFDPFNNTVSYVFD